MDLNKMAVNIYRLIKLQGSSLIHFVSMHAKNEYILSSCKLTGPRKKNQQFDRTSKEDPCRI